MAKKKSAAETLQRAKERGSGEDTEIINDDPVHTKLQPAVARNYQKQIDLWLAYQQQNPDASPYDLVSLKKFVRAMALAIDGAECIPEACKETVRKYWNSFTAGWQRQHPGIPREIADSVTQFIKGPLAEELNLTNAKRPRRFATKIVLNHLANQLFAVDWFVYKSPATRLDDWAIQLGNTFSSARIGEYIESSCRSKTGRGLHYKDLVFGVFLNELGNPEFALQLTRDAKNMSDTPEKRPQHALYEGERPGLLCFNPMLFYLSRLLARSAFRDYRTYDELLRIVPPEGEMLHLHWKEKLLETPLFISESTERIETAGAFSKRLRSLGLRAGYPQPARNHDFRAEGLYWMNQFAPEATRMVYAGHTDPNTVPRHYLPRNGADGQQAYFGSKGRTLVGDLFRGLTVPRNPRLWQCLPAEKQYLLEDAPEFRRLEEQITTLEGARDKESVRSRKALYDERRQLEDKALRDWQKRQPIKYDDPPGYHRAIFDRARFMMPERDRLASSLFQVDTLRSPTGLAVLRDLMALYQRRSEVTYRPGLEPDKCNCRKKDDPQLGLETITSYDWRHVYTCYKKIYSDHYGFAELCFHCNEWMIGSEAWNDHCQEHINNLETFPVWCDSLTYDGVLATAGYCPFCLTDARLPAATRMYQFLNRWKWLEHVHKHVQNLDNGKPAWCPHPQPSCADVFESVLHLQFHLQDAHGIDFIRERVTLKRSREESEEIRPGRVKRQRQACRRKAKEYQDAAIKVGCTFINTTMDTMSDRWPSQSEKSSGDSTPICSWDSPLLEDGVPFEYETPLSSVCNDEIIDPAILPAVAAPGLGAIEVVDLTGVADISAKYSDAEINQNDSARVRDAKEEQELTPNIPAETKKQNHSVLRAPPTVSDDRIPVSSCLFQDDVLVRAEEESEYRPLAAVDPDDNQWAVEKLIERRRIGRAVKYLVKWLGYPESENSWERKKDIDSDTVAAFEAELLLAQN